jgi:hypothetical protein
LHGLGCVFISSAVNLHPWGSHGRVLLQLCNYYTDVCPPGANIISTDNHAPWSPGHRAHVPLFFVYTVATALLKALSLCPCPDSLCCGRVDPSLPCALMPHSAASFVHVCGTADALKARETAPCVSWCPVLGHWSVLDKYSHNSNKV